MQTICLNDENHEKHGTHERRVNRGRRIGFPPLIDAASTNDCFVRGGTSCAAKQYSLIRESFFQRHYLSTHPALLEHWPEPDSPDLQTGQRLQLRLSQ